MKVKTQTFEPMDEPTGEEGKIYFDDSSKKIKTYGNGTWSPLNDVPVGCIFSWLKSFTNTPSLLSNWVECNGQVLSDSESVYDGETIPDLNGDNRFLRGDSTSGSTGGSETMSHTHTVYNNGYDQHGGAGTQTVNAQSTSGASNTENRPPFYNVVWIMKIK